jgi:hypothetical protein
MGNNEDEGEGHWNRYFETFAGASYSEIIEKRADE